MRVYVDFGNTFVFRDLPIERNEEVRTLGAHWDKIRNAWIVPASVLVALSVVNSPRKPEDDISELEAWLGKLRHKILLSEQCVPPNGQTIQLKNSPMTHQDVGQNRIRYMKRNGLWWDMGSGKCVVGESEVWTTSGPIAIADLWARDKSSVKEDGEGGQWGSLANPVEINTLLDGKICPVLTNKVYRQRVAEDGTMLTLADGSSITCTKRHSFLTPAGWRHSAELVPGDYVAVPARTVQRPASSMPDAVAELMAWQLAEGHEHPEGPSGSLANWTFTNSDLQVMARLRVLASSCGVDLCPIRMPGYRTPSVSTSRLRPLFEKWGYQSSRYSKDKAIPSEVFKASESARKAFVSAFFDAEGYVGKNAVELQSASRAVAFGLRDLLRPFGVWLKIHPKLSCATNGKRIKRVYWRCTFSGNSVTRFHEAFKFRTLYKQEALDRLAAKKHNDNMEGIPAWTVMLEASIVYGLGKKRLRAGTIYKRQGMGRQLALGVCERLAVHGATDLSRQMAILVSEGIHWCRVVSTGAVRISDYVYDLGVDGSHNYVVNGMVTHNTYGALWVAEEIFKFEGKGKVLILCPLSLMSTWREEMAAHLTVIPKVIEIKGPKKRRSKLLQEWMKPNPVRLTFGIMSWDVARRMAEEFPPDFKFDFVIGDETGFIKNKSAQRTQAAIAIADKAEYVVALNGTPYISNVTDFWAQMRFLGEMYSGPSFMRFAQRYMEMDENSRKVPKDVKEEMKPELKELMGYAGMSVRKEDVMPELPAKSYSVRWVEPSGDQKEAIDRAMDEFHFAVEAVKKGADTSTQQFVLIKNAMSRITRVQQIGMGWTKNAEGDIIYFKDNAKGDAVLDLSEEARGQKVVIFSRFVEDLWVMEKLLGKAGFHAVSYHGRMPADHAETARELFTKGKAEYFLSQVQKGGFGLNLQMSSTCAFTNNWWSYGVRSQAEGRLHRKGQKNAVLYVDIALKNSIDEYLVNSFKQQKDLVNYLFGKRMSEADLIRMAGNAESSIVLH